MATIKRMPPLDKSRPDTRRSGLLLVFVAAFAVRLLYGASRQLVPDEAFYWVLSRHLHAGYLDHPPMVALLIRLGTLMFGSTELGVRSMAAITSFGAVLVLLSLSRRIVNQERAGIFLTAIWLCSPLLAVVGTIMTPDAPSIFFSVCAMACAVRIALRLEESEPGPTLPLWLAFGASTGLAMLSKYTSVLPAGAVALAMLTTPRGRAELRRPGPWLAILVALLVFSPVIQWNAAHDWASFKFQLHHGLDEAEATTGPQPDWARQHVGALVEYIGGQLAVFTPIFFIFAVVVLGIKWRYYATLSLARRILVWSSTVPPVFFGFAAFKSGSAGEMNWPAFAYFPMSLLMVDHIARLWKPGDVRLLKIGCAIGLLILIPLHAPELLTKSKLLKDHFPRKLNELYGWRELAHDTIPYTRGALLIAGRHQDAGELSFYLPGQPQVWCYPEIGTDGKPLTRPTSFDYFPDRPDPTQAPTVLYVQGHPDAFMRQYGFGVAEKASFHFFLNGRMRDRSMVFLEKGLSPTTAPTSHPTGRAGRPARSTKNRPATTSTSSPTTTLSR